MLWREPGTGLAILLPTHVTDLPQLTNENRRTKMLVIPFSQGSKAFVLPYEFKD